MREKLFDYFSYLTLTILVIVTYRYLLGSFFQQDEWVSLGQVIGSGLFAGLNTYSPFYYLAGYIRFLGSFLNNFFHYFFPFNPIPFAIAGIIFHSINSSLVYVFGKTLTKSRIISFVAAAFFAVSTIHQQAISWFASTMTTLPSLGFSLIGLIFVVEGVQKNKLKYLFIGQISVMISYLFKESSMGILLLLPCIYLFGKNLSAKTIKKTIYIFPLSIFYFLYVLFVRLSILYSPEGKVAMFITKESNATFLLIKNAFLFPLIGLSQTFIPHQLLQSEGETLSIILSLCIFVLCILYFYFDKKMRLPLFISFVIIVLNFIPLAAIKRGLDVYFDSRYYYQASVGAALLLGIGFYWFKVLFFKKQSKIFHILFIGLSFVLAGFLYKNTSLTRAHILQQNIEGKERQDLLLQIKTTYPLPIKRPIFYITGDSQGYYGVSNQKIPLQQGVGYTLMILYNNTEIIPSSFLRDWFLWDIHEQGYRTEGENGFGYFYSYEDLIQTMKINKAIDSNQVYAFYYYSYGPQRKLVDITQEIRSKLDYELGNF